MAYAYLCGTTLLSKLRTNINGEMNSVLLGKYHKQEPDSLFPCACCDRLSSYMTNHDRFLSDSVCLLGSFVLGLGTTYAAVASYN